MVIKYFCNHDCRFLYPVYPLVCVAASAVIESFPDLFRDKFDPNANYGLVTVGLKFSDCSIYLS